MEELPLREAVVLAEREAADTPEREAVDTPERVVLAERVTEEARAVRLPEAVGRTLAPPEETVPVRTERELEPTRELLRAVPTRVEVMLRTSLRKAPPRAL